jgi:hypothetical protein
LRKQRRLCAQHLQIVADALAMPATISANDSTLSSGPARSVMSGPLLMARRRATAIEPKQ